MAGFIAEQEVEELTYDFRPHADVHGVIPEPSSKQIEVFRNVIVGAIKGLGLSPEDLASDTVSFDMLDELMEKSEEVEVAVLGATAGLTGIDPGVIENLPYRVKSAFMGWIMGTFFSPEA